MKAIICLVLALLLLGACTSAVEPTVAQQVPGGAAVQAKVSTGEPGSPPVEIRIPSAVGEVVFLHERHFKDRQIACAECHHQIDAKKLETPHPEYLESSWIKCKICHSDQPGQKAVFTCSNCHRSTPASIADETLSAKVVVHRQCWKCHSVGTAADASQGCILCHAGRKSL